MKPSIARKPVGSLQTVTTSFESKTSPPSYIESEATLVEQTSDLSLQTTQSDDEFLGKTPFDEDPEFVQTPLSEQSSLASPTDSSNWKKKSAKAWEETRHFAGGLVSHPFEHNKHFSILRHSHGIVYYKGPATNVAITILSDNPLPADRTLWVQRKGWTGKTGMKIKSALGTNGSWVNITPSESVTPDQLPHLDERAWQRDIAKFLKKAANGPKEIRNHRPRETAVLRIPAEVTDGYFRIVLCAGEGSKSVLCPSPIFRVASTSTSGSSIKGASFSTLPVEIGIKVGSVMAKNAAGNLISPVTSQIQNQFGQYKPGFVAQEAASTAYSASGVGNRVDTVNEKYDQSREPSYPSSDPNQVVIDDIDAARAIIDADSGPTPPFPIHFSGTVVPGTGRSSAAFGLPTANMSGVRDEITLKLSGVYFGWSSIMAKDTKSKKEDSPAWHKSLISIAPCPYTPPSAVPTRVIRIHLLLHDHHAIPSLTGSKLSVLIAGLIRSSSSSSSSSSSTTHPSSPTDNKSAPVPLFNAHDINTTLSTLSPARPAWQPDALLQLRKSLSKERSLTDRVVDARTYGQRQVDRVPVHRLGVRTQGHRQRDALVGKGGVWVVR